MIINRGAAEVDNHISRMIFLTIALVGNRSRIGVVHHVTDLIFYNITGCYGKHVAVFAVAVAKGDIIKYQSFVYGSFVWGIHVRYNNANYLVCFVLYDPSFGQRILRKNKKTFSN